MDISMSREDYPGLDRIPCEVLAEVLESTGAYKILRMLPAPQPFIMESDGTEPFRKICIVDTETTGLDDKCKIIEMMVLPVWIDEWFRVRSIGEPFHGFQDPGEELSEEVERVTGLTRFDLMGKFLNKEELAACAEQCSMFIAHNAGFDRGVVERELRDVAPLCNQAWACSAMELPWRVWGSPSASQPVIANTLGFFYDAHRASNDVMALLSILMQPLQPPMGEGTILEMLLRKCDGESFRVWAHDSDYNAKDQLKARGYKWHDGTKGGLPKNWYRDLWDREAAREELVFLQGTKLAPKAYAKRMTALERYL